ncbi:MAG: DNA-binding protein [Saprospiraceae bacterium]
MNITFEQLRQIKHQLPAGSVRRIAKELQIEEQAVRNYFGANKYENTQLIGRHVQAGPHGGIVNLDDTRIFDMANRIIRETQLSNLVSS